MELFAIQNLTFTYPEQEKPVLKNVSLSLNQGDFAVLAGPSGCGKSTLLRQMKTVLAPHGKRTGEVTYLGQPLDEVENTVQAAKIGFVMQDPDSQIVTDKVWHELAFELESLGMDNTTIRGRVAEMASFFGIQTWFHMDVTQLSGGQETAAESGSYHGSAAGYFDSGRANQPAGSHCGHRFSSDIGTDQSGTGYYGSDL